MINPDSLTRHILFEKYIKKFPAFVAKVSSFPIGDIMSELTLTPMILKEKELSNFEPIRGSSWNDSPLRLKKKNDVLY